MDIRQFYENNKLPIAAGASFLGLVLIFLLIYSHLHSNVPDVQVPSTPTERIDTARLIREAQDRSEEADRLEAILDQTRAKLGRSDSMLILLEKLRVVDNKNVLDADIIKSIDASREELTIRGYR